MSLDRSGEQLDAIRSAIRLIAHPCPRLGRCSHERHRDVVLFDKAADVNRHRRPERLADCQNPRPADLAGIDPLPQRDRVVENGGDVEDCRETPAVQHRVECGVEVAGLRLAHMQQCRREDMDVTVPESGRYEFAGAVDHLCAGGYLHRLSVSNGGDFSVVNQHNCVLDRCGVRLRVYRRAYDCQIARVGDRNEAESEQKDHFAPASFSSASPVRRKMIQSSSGTAPMLL